MPGGLLTDLYELNMAASYLRRSMIGAATFSLFVRHLPQDRGFLIAAGLDDCLAFLEGFCFSEDELAWLAASQGYDERTQAEFRRLRFTGACGRCPRARRSEAR
jgi:nicotinate phosphoribosyltransferase